MLATQFRLITWLMIQNPTMSYGDVRRLLEQIDEFYEENVANR